MIDRHSKLMEIITKENISTQEELTAKLREAGYDVTQATVSRDIKKLRISKVVNNHGESHYVAVSEDSDSSSYNLFASSVVAVHLAMNLVVIKTFPGMASAIGAVVDSMHISQALGSIAGDDTLMVIAENIEDAKLIYEKLHSMR
ncbi:MAG: arginine repressor [Eubacteriales bacterium]|nr:arginine repressor [Eubacteriales bacterium]